MSLLDLLNEANTLKETAQLHIIKNITNGDWQQALLTLQEAENELLERQAVNAEPLSEAEFNLAKRGDVVTAIQLYRNRTKCRVMLAKKVVENARDSYKQSQKEK